MGEPVFIYDTEGREHRVTWTQPLIEAYLLKGWTMEPVADFNSMSDAAIVDMAKKRGIPYATQKKRETLIKELTEQAS